MDPYLTWYTKYNSKGIKDLNRKRETVKLIEENIGEKLFDIRLGSDFFATGYDTTSTGKSKNQQMGLHQTKNPVHNKGNNQLSENTTYWMEENIFKPYIW